MKNLHKIGKYNIPTLDRNMSVLFKDPIAFDNAIRRIKELLDAYKLDADTFIIHPDLLKK